METIEDSYDFSEGFKDFLEKAAAYDPIVYNDEEDGPQEDKPESEEEEEPEEDWKGKYDELQSENETLKNQVADFRFAQNEAIQNDDLLYNSYNQGGNSSILNMVMGDEIEEINVATKSKNVSFANFDPTLKGYLNDLQNKFGNKVVVTSANDQEHAPNSRHYQGEAVDLRFSPEVHKYIANDPVAKKLGLEVLDPNHGTAPHTHIQKRAYGGGDPPYIKRNSKGQKELIGEKLPLTHKYDDTRNWMIDWLKQRNSQYEAIAPAQYKQDNPFMSLFGTNKENIASTVKDMRETAINNVKTVGYGDESVIPGDALVDVANSYTHGDHRITFPFGADKGSVAHETGHATLLTDKTAVKNYIWDVIDQDPHVKKERDSYYHSPSEVYSRIWDLRRTYDLKPNQVVTPELLRQKQAKQKESYIKDGSEEIYNYLDENTIIKLLNGLVSNDKPSNTKVKYGGKYKV